MNEVHIDHANKDQKNGVLKMVGPALLIVLSFMLLGIGVLFLTDKLQTDELKGIWTTDDVTSYQFDGRGTGKLILPSSEYEFTYQLEDGTLSIDYKSERAMDAVYTIAVEGKMIRLSQEEPGKETVNITMYKKEQ